MTDRLDLSTIFRLNMYLINTWCDYIYYMCVYVSDTWHMNFHIFVLIVLGKY